MAGASPSGRPTGTREFDDEFDALLTKANTQRPADEPTQRPETISRTEVWDNPVVDGRIVSQSPLARAIRWLRELLTSESEREEAQLVQQLLALPRSTSAQIIPIMSPKGGVGKTSTTFLVGSLLASLGHRVIAVDSNPDSGTLGKLVATHERQAASLSDLLLEIDEVDEQAKLGRYVSRLSTGLHVLAGARDPRHAAAVGQSSYLKLVALLAHYYDVVLLDLGTGISEDIPQFALGEAHQVVLVMTPELATVEVVLDGLPAVTDAIRDRPITCLLNKVPAKRAGARGQDPVDRIRQKVETLGTTLELPEDPQLRLMLDSGTYSLERLSRPTRLAIRRLTVAVGRNIS